MAYSDIALLSSDNDFINRVRACAVTEGEADPVAWAQQFIWQVAAAPGFGDAYATALLNGVVRPGNDPSVISDAQILSAVQPLRAGEPQGDATAIVA